VGNNTELTVEQIRQLRASQTDVLAETAAKAPARDSRGVGPIRAGDRVFIPTLGREGTVDPRRIQSGSGSEILYIRFDDDTITSVPIGAVVRRPTPPGAGA
jgi:hypothetical protein